MHSVWHCEDDWPPWQGGMSRAAVNHVFVVMMGGGLRTLQRPNGWQGYVAVVLWCILAGPSHITVLVVSL